MPKPAHVQCREVGRFISKGGCYALHRTDGAETWLEIEPVPLQLIDQDVEITGERNGTDLIWVSAIGPTPRFS
ncbi:hypothetical protein G432_20620 (plasmid) [Sphingomonas sp. MM-1]|uniref:DUF5818 domain-containing protein n=1 Tax=Sphingomonas sp. MM-1 TaxID=745310 RepID=UPI0002C158F5|nr:DUF5818 domain-containing protein [Sphingomonas sp. MM-1]AGH51806.1 hypothetical protein G432_20620 [Sphingomonas sp. MM-1]